MDLIIKGMEMPRSCLECKLTWIDDDYNKACCFTNVVALNIGRQNACPLVELTEHGNLIDRDAFVEDLTNSADKLIRFGIYLAL